MKIPDTITAKVLEIRAKSNVICESLWYVNPSDIEQALLDVRRETIEEFYKSLEENRKETLWGDEDSNQVMNLSIDAFIEAVKDDFNPNTPTV